MGTTILVLTALIATLLVTPPLCLAQPASTAPVVPSVSTAPVEPPVEPLPTYGAVAYGQRPKQVLTFWQAKSDKPTPWLFHIHGGGWTSQQRIFGLVAVPGFVQDMLNYGISVVTVEYRLIGEATADGVSPPVKGPMLDCARALQFVRSKSKEWNLDKQRVALCGDSAGGCTALWLAFHQTCPIQRATIWSPANSHGSFALACNIRSPPLIRSRSETGFQSSNMVTKLSASRPIR